MHDILAIYLPVLAVALGAIFHSLSADGGASVLDHFGVTWRFPKATLPLAVIAVGAGSYFVNAYLGGQDVNHALAAALADALASIFGGVAHHAVSSKGGGKGTGPAIVLLAGIVAFVASACTPAQLHAVGDLARVVECVADNQEKPDAEVIALCAEQNVPPSDILDLLRKQRAATARAAKRLGAAACQ